MEYNLNDIVKTKKSHPCGNDLWKIIRVGADIKIKCIKCQHVVMLERSKFEKSIKCLVEKN